MRLRALLGLAPVALAVAATLAASPSHAKRPEACAPGRFLVAGEPIVPELPAGEATAVVVAQPLELPGLCEPATKTKLRGGKKATKVTASWQACAGLRGRPKLTGKVVDDCSRLVGTLRARKYKRKFEALRSRCGDGVVDAGGGEQCEPPGTEGCRADCRFVAPPRVSLRAAPAAGVAPLATTLEAVAEGLDAGPLTYHWTFGDGTEADGPASIAHTYPEPGVQRCTVSVSDGEHVASAALLVDVGGDAVETSVGPGGGEVALGRLRLAVPAGLLPEAVEARVLELPSLEGAAPLDPQRFRPIGPAYRLDLPLRAADPLELELSWAEEDVPPGFEHLGVLWRVEPVVEGTAPDGLAVVLVPDAAVADPPAHALRARVTGSVVVQALAMAAPLRVERARAAASEPRAAAQPPLVIVSFVDEPPDPTAYAAAVRAAVAAAFEALVVQRGFPEAGRDLTVTVAALADAEAGVSAKIPGLMLVDPDRVPIARLPSVVAHEYFHVLQFWSSNEQSVSDANRWFIEGAAEWARDEVLDAVSGHYRAPAGTRFESPLNQPVGFDEPTAYEAVAFWKWLESAAPGLIAGMVQDHRARTRTRVGSSPPIDVLSDADAPLLDSLLALHPAIDFLDFALAALWSKDYDANETGAGDLWDPARLGPAKQVPAGLERVVELKRGAPGDSEANPLTVPYILGAHLTADSQQLASLDGSLSGTLHLRFPARADHRIGVAVVAPASGREVVIHDLSSERTVEMGIGAGDQVVVIETDGDWSAPGAGPHSGSFEAWVEPCGGPADGRVFPVDSADALRAALLGAAPGDTVELAAGTYIPPVTEWPFWASATLPGIAMVPRGVTLAGAGASETTIIAAGDGSDLYLKDGATLRDLRVRFTGTWQGIWAGGAEDEGDATREVSLCNVDASFALRPPNPTLTHVVGITFEPAYPGSYAFEMHGSTVSCAGTTAAQSTGLEIWPSAPTGVGQTVSVRIRGSTITGCDTGVSYMEDTAASVDMDAECAGIRGNRDENLSRCECSSSPCACTEECPEVP